jgi:hypothetical protein
MIEQRHILPGATHYDRSLDLIERHTSPIPISSQFFIGRREDGPDACRFEKQAAHARDIQALLNVHTFKIGFW